ncbi:MAG: peptide chain release factor N(5)-glutamine methyltransferase [Oxalobacteraceae bacterium]|jgi:release factor glutamine methyltransferase|nr:peptide chain release factor N(5)-glutamine methyltransferase [Oxalobacteraceae bacterium]
MNIEALLKLSLIDPLEAQVLLAHALKCTRVQLVIRSKDELSPQQVTDVSALFMRRMQGEPIAYLTGEREFHGLRFEITPDVLIPRHETELLVELGMAKLPKGGSVLDLGTGSGAIAVSLAHARRDAQVTASDISPDALSLARRNAAAHAVALQFVQSNWFEQIEGKFDLVISNPPYIAASDPHLMQGDLRFEPRAALTDEANGMMHISTIVDGAVRHLKPGGWLLLEHGYDQSAAVRALLQKSGWQQVQSWKDLAGIERVSGAVLEGNHPGKPL